MHDPQILRIGRLACFGVALGYVLTGVAALLMPAELQGRPEITPHQFWMVLSAHPTAHLCFHWAWVWVGLCGIGAVPVVSLLAWHAQRGLVLWSGLAAWLGFAVHARSHLMEVAWDRKIIAVYPTADAAFQQAVHVVAGLALDLPDGVLTYGAVGLWIAAVSVLARRAGTAPNAFAALGVATAIAFAIGVLGYGLRWHAGIAIAVGAGLVLAPAWFVWAGLLLGRGAFPVAPTDPTPKRA